MKSVAQAFDRFRASLVLTPAEKKNVQSQQVAMRERLNEKLTLDRHFLSGSFSRSTALRPLNDVDMLVVLRPSVHGELRQAGPKACLQAVFKALRELYPHNLPRLQRRSVGITFRSPPVGYDVVPAFAVDGPPQVYEIPDREAKAWIRTSPDRQKPLLNQADQRAGSKLRPLIRMAKTWNSGLGTQKPLRSFHLEVMSHSAFRTPPADYASGLAELFAHLTRQVTQRCPDPTGVGPDLDEGWSKRQHALNCLRNAERQARRALALEKQSGDLAGAHWVWRQLLGPAYPEGGRKPSGN